MIESRERQTLELTEEIQALNSTILTNENERNELESKIGDLVCFLPHI